MLALDKRWLGATGLSPARLAGWTGLAGPYDFCRLVSAKPRWPLNGRAQRLKSSGVRVESELYDTVSHIMIVATMASVLRSRAPVLGRVTGFVKRNARI